MTATSRRRREGARSRFFRSGLGYFLSQALYSSVRLPMLGRRRPVYMVLTWGTSWTMLSAVARIHRLKFSRYPSHPGGSNSNDIIASRLPTPTSTTTGLLLLSAPDRGQVSNQRMTWRAPHGPRIVTKFPNAEVGCRGQIRNNARASISFLTRAT